MSDEEAMRRMVEAHEKAGKILKRAAEIIAQEEAWIQGPMSVDEDGHSVEPGESSACGWCCLGAITLASEQLLEEFDDTRVGENGWPYGIALDAVARGIDVDDEQREYVESFSLIAEWNDSCGRKHDEVLQALHEGVEHASGF